MDEPSYKEIPFRNRHPWQRLFHPQFRSVFKPSLPYPPRHDDSNRPAIRLGQNHKSAWINRAKIHRSSVAKSNPSSINQQTIHGTQCQRPSQQTVSK
ncbi:hypothetical protein ACLOJK_040505 [Asimina triloba]